MSEKECCPADTCEELNKELYETIRIAKTGNSCYLCEEYAERHASKPVAVISCEGACLRGEIARQAANILCHFLAPAKTVRICLGGAFTKDTGQRMLVRNAGRVVAVEGCHINCSSRMMAAVVPGLKPEVIIADRLYECDKRLFGIHEMAPEEILIHGRTVAGKIAESVLS